MLDYQFYVTSPILSQTYGPDSAAEFTALIVKASGCVFDPRMKRIDLVVDGREHRFCFSHEGEFSSAMTVVKNGGLPLVEQAAITNALWITNIAGLSLLVVLWLLQGWLL